MRADGAAHLEVSAGSTPAAASGARVAAVPEAEADPESLASLWMLRRHNRNTQHQQRHDHRTAARDVPHGSPRWEERSPILEIGLSGARKGEPISELGYVERDASLAAVRDSPARRAGHLRLRGPAAGGQAHAPLVRPRPRGARLPD